MITASGIGSGLDIEGLVAQLVAAERAPTENRLNRQSALVEAELSAFGTYKGALSSLQDTLASLNTLSNFGQRVSASSNDDIVSIASNGSAINGSYDVSVQQLARAHSLASGSYAAPTDVVGTGTITIRFGTTDYAGPDPGPESYNGFTVNPERASAVIAIDGNNNSLEGVRDAINAADIGVNATIVNDGSGYRLLFSSDATGADNSMEISVADTGDGNSSDAFGLSALAFSSAGTNLSQTVAAQDANFTVNGLPISSDSNVASGVIDGVDITLKGLTDATAVTLSVSEDTAGLKENVQSLVDGFNAFLQGTRSLTAFDATSGIAGALQGDASIRSISTQLRQALTSVVDGASAEINSLSQIGITTTRDGSLEVDEARLDAALANNFDDIVGLFAAVGLPSDSGIDFIGAGDDTQVGSYAIEISQIATRGLYTGGALALPGGVATVNAGNDELSLRVDGVDTGPVVLTQGVYASGEALAAELQSRINSDDALLAAGVSVSVSFVGGSLSITSQRYGSASSVEITAVDTTSAADFGLSVGAGTQGVDVAGTIGGVAALGSGQLLTAATGSEAEGLRLLVEGGLTGARGTVDFTRGIADQLNTLIGRFLEADGILDSRTDGLESRVDRLDDQRDRLDLRMESLEAFYRARFNALDTLLAQLQSTSNFLTQQLAALPEAGSLNRN
ncbi:MAG: flagellar filament capping protein FliD [Gammaproteobacteria bacterium]|nr:flagellar filament capping protein FliD [Gammaproteobacteria bacterium]